MRVSFPIDFGDFRWADYSTPVVIDTAIFISLGNRLMNDLDRPQFDSDRPFGLPSTSPQGHWPGEGQSTGLGRWALKNIWLHPRDTIRTIVENDPERHVNLLIILAGITESLDRASTKNAADKISLGGVFFIVCVLGPGFSLIGAWVYSHLIRIAGNWIGGRGHYEEIKACIGWSAVPTLVSLVLWLPLLGLFGKGMFSAEMPALTGRVGLATILIAISFIQLILGLWASVLLCKTIAEVQEYRSAWKGLWNLILAGAIVIVPMLVIIGGIMLLTSDAMR